MAKGNPVNIPERVWRAAVTQKVRGDGYGGSGKSFLFFLMSIE